RKKKEQFPFFLKQYKGRKKKDPGKGNNEFENLYGYLRKYRKPGGGARRCRDLFEVRILQGETEGLY
ncbi:hypothetical protein V4Y02_23685, partial [Escherichia coli]